METKSYHTMGHGHAGLETKEQDVLDSSTTTGSNKSQASPTLPDESNCEAIDALSRTSIECNASSVSERFGLLLAEESEPARHYRNTTEGVSPNYTTRRDLTQERLEALQRREDEKLRQRPLPNRAMEPKPSVAVTLQEITASLEVLPRDIPRSGAASDLFYLRPAHL